MRGPERRSAANALGRVLRDGAWSNVVVRTEARSAEVEVAPVQGLVFDALRHLPGIDAVITDAARRPIGKIDPAILDLLRISTGEMIRGDRPVALIVDGAVEAVRGVNRRAAGFANAVLRRISAAETPPGDPASIGIPAFVDDALRHVLPDHEVDALWAASQASPRVGVRSGTPIPDADAVDGIDSAWLLSPGVRPGRLPVQDPASVAVGNTAAAPVGGIVADLAAAPGGKTAHLCEQVTASGTVVAMDRHARRVRDASRRFPDAMWLIGDAAAPPLSESSFDVVVVDAPCSGLGTLRRRPEIRFRVSPPEVSRLARTQRAMLEAALLLARPGGRVVYSVCTVVPAETIDVVAGLGAVAPPGLPGRPFGDGWLLAPHLGPTDGMFIAVFER